MIDDPAQGPIDAPAGGGLFGDAPPQRRPRIPSTACWRANTAPRSFEDLIGQEPMVRTLSNAFDLGRIHQAYMLTGVRGVGKTTTARILARAFNYEVAAREGRPAIDKPTIHMDEIGLHCQAIMESRHVDVIEMDAASHTGIDDVREIIESARYKPVMARTKVYIIDEVHMLSKPAFNGLLKTLEEPPEHVKFLFATTEIDKVPVTVRSRCLRFDLRRVEAEVLARHLATICDKEKVEIDHEALILIARATEGSVRDALSLLDQAIAHGAGAPIHADNLRLMLGLADRSRIIDLFEAVDEGRRRGGVGQSQRASMTPAPIRARFSPIWRDFVHLVTTRKIAPDLVDPAASQSERERGAFFAQNLSMSVLSRAWQILLKGMQEIKDLPRPLRRRRHGAGAPRLCRRPAVAGRGAQAPDLFAGRALRLAGAAWRRERFVGRQRRVALRAAPGRRATALCRAAAPQAKGDSAPTLALNSFAELVALAGTQRDIQLKTALERDVRLVRFEQGVLEFSLAPGGSPHLAAQLMRKLQDWTGQRWMVALSTAPGTETLVEQAETKEKERRIGVQAHPLVRATLDQFPGAVIVAVRGGETEPVGAPDAKTPAVADDVAFIDESEDEDF